MPRKSTKSHEAGDVVQTNLRWRKDEHEWLVSRARARGTTLNAEIAWRVMRSREQDDALQLRGIADEVARRLEPYLTSAMKCALYNDALFAARQLIDLVNPLLAIDQIGGSTGKKMRQAIDNYYIAHHALERVISDDMLRQGSTGAQASMAAKVQAAGGAS
jgi:hypothetical protein